ncbi:hypothetical protein BH09ACT4_BH09ACT4_17040 [soil metagenome]
MLTGSGGTPNVILFISGLFLIAAGGAAIYWREGVGEYLRDLRSQFFGEPTGGRSKKSPGTPWLPLIAGVILIAVGIIGASGGLFATLPPPGTPRV